MTDHRGKEIVPTRVDPAPVSKITAADMVRMDHVPPGLMPHQPQVIYVQKEPEYRGDDLLRRFLPYFVISVMGLVILGGVAAILGMVIPMIMAAILAVVASFVSIILSIVATIISGAVIAVAITWCQASNARNKIGRGR